MPNGHGNGNGNGGPGLYDRLDAVVGGILPGGVALGTTSYELGQQVGAAPGAPLMGALGGAALPAAGGVRGRRMTAVATVLPTGQIIPRSVTPGGVALYTRDLTAAKRVKRVGGRINRLFPRARRRKGKK